MTTIQDRSFAQRTDDALVAASLPRTARPMRLGRLRGCAYLGERRLDPAAQG